MAYIKIAIMHLSLIEIILCIILGTYILIFLLIFIGWHQLNEILSDSELPSVSVSVIIAARNESSTLPLLLNDLYHQLYPKEYFDIIIIDDHSEQSVGELDQVKNFPLNNLKVVSLSNNKFGKKQALLLGASQSKAELLLFTDADCRIGERWIQTFVKYYYRNASDCLIGLVTYEPEPGFFQSFYQADLVSLVVSAAGTASLGFSTICNGANFAVKRNIYSKYAERSYTNINSGDDVYLLHALKKNNKSITVVKNKAGIVRTKAPITIKDFLNQRIRWASKGIQYNDTATVLLALLVYMSNFSLLSAILFSFLGWITWFVCIILFFLKIITDCLLLTAGLRYFEIKRIIYLVPFYELLYPLYALVMPILGILNLYTWKGRSARKNHT